MTGSKPMVWRVEIAPEEFKRFGDCNRDELEAAAALIKDRARSRDLSTAGELHEDGAARLGLMGMTDQERWLVSVVELIKTVAAQQIKGRNA
jgi:hypothetical protein